ncbi:hypothetical protein [Cerasicoccus maritimus]|uniref:hypothetical protein n=1 Tax=Cerasicoccus maritimus TaxID=490089 RepID=UPI0028529BF1|nr:hypothetical protein [Cerasicoccus maritimus]
MNSQQLIAKLKQYPLAVICTLVVLVMLGLSFLRSGNLPELNAEYDALQEEAEVISRNSSNAVDLTANLEELSKLVESVDARLIDADSVTANYRYFLGMGERSNVKYVNDPPAATYVKSARFKSYALAEFQNVAVQGTYQNVLNYLYEVRTGEYLMRIDSISITPKASGDKEEVVASLKITGLAKKRPETKKKKKK